jgi:hypothetical protein
MKAEPVAQLELIGQLVGRNAVIADHLRMRRKLGVDREQRIEHHVAVVARNVGGGPDRIQHPQIRLRDEAQSLRVGRAGIPAKAAAGQGRRRGGDPEFTTCQPVKHPYLRRFELTSKMWQKLRRAAFD